MTTHPLDDLTVTKLCAIAMGEQIRDDLSYLLYWHNHGWQMYAPLTDDAQCMALVKKFDMVIEREKDKSFGTTLFWGCYKNGKPTSVIRNQPDLNRAICLAVARMQLAKETPK